MYTLLGKWSCDVEIVARKGQVERGQGAGYIWNFCDVYEICIEEESTYDTSLLTASYQNVSY